MFSRSTRRPMVPLVPSIWSIVSAGTSRRRREKRPDFPVIFITGRPDAMPGGAQSPRDAIVPKPYLPSEVTEIAHRLTGF